MPVPDILYVLCVYKNLEGFSPYSRYMIKNYFKFHKHVHDSGGTVYTAEISVKGNGFVATSPVNPYDLQLHTDCPEIWNRDRAFNMLLDRLPPAAKYIAYTDTDIHFANPDWVSETIRQLGSYRVVQMWSHTRDLNARYFPTEEDEVYESWAYSFDGYTPSLGWKPDKFTGMAWAWQRDVLDKAPMIDWIISGQSDTEYCLAMINELRMGSTNDYNDKYVEWGKKVYSTIAGKVGYVPGLLLHHYHGPRERRGYDVVRQILVNHKFDPTTDIELDGNGLYRWTRKNLPLESAMREWYARREAIKEIV